jgi:DNA-binding NtrC family response regulator
MSCHPWVGYVHDAAYKAKRREDIAGLANHFLNKYGWAMQADYRQSTPAGFTKPAKLYWPGKAP